MRVAYEHSFDDMSQKGATQETQAVKTWFNTLDFYKLYIWYVIGVDSTFLCSTTPPKSQISLFGFQLSEHYNSLSKSELNLFGV